MNRRSEPIPVWQPEESFCGSTRRRTRTNSDSAQPREVGSASTRLQQLQQEDRTGHKHPRRKAQVPRVLRGRGGCQQGGEGGQGERGEGGGGRDGGEQRGGGEGEEEEK